MRAVVWFLAAATFLMVPAAAAQAPIIAALPEQLHVTLGAEPGTLVVQWAVAGLDYSSAEQPLVEWSIDGADAQVAYAAKVGEVVSGNPLAPQLPGSTHVYAATLGPIPSGAEVRYMAGSGVRGYTLRHTASMIPGPGDSLRFVTYADIGLDGVAADGSKAPNQADDAPFEVRDLAIKLAPSLVVVPGDLPYNNQRAGWDSFMRFLEPLASQIPVMPTVGNHEWDDALGYDQFLAEFALPNDETSYRFTAGPVTFIAVNSDVICRNHARASTGTAPRPCDDGDGGTPNLELLGWVEEALEATAADATPWTVVYHHHPPFSHGSHGSDYAAQVLLSPLYERYGVDLVITGHDHVYGRTFPVRDALPVVTGTNEFTKGDGPVYVVVGGGGRSLYSYSQAGAPAWHAAGASVHHLGLVDVNATQLHFRTLRSADESPLDEFWIRTPMGFPSASSAAVEGPQLLLVLASGIAPLAFIRRRL